jgi:hypothetical protein
MDIFILIVAAIFIFAVATLFRSNEALDRVKGVEKELDVLEDEVKEMGGHSETLPVEQNKVSSLVPPVVPQGA